jgi:hypothetical protein
MAAVSVISYTSNPVYVLFAATGSWVGAYMSMTWLKRGEPAITPLRPGPP